MSEAYGEDAPRTSSAGFLPDRGAVGGGCRLAGPGCHLLPGLAGLPAEEIELRTFGNGQYYGRFMLKPKPGSRPSLQARLVAVTLANQAGRALAAGQAARN
jgi:hypothetical protein